MKRGVRFRKRREYAFPPTGDLSHLFDISSAPFQSRRRRGPFLHQHSRPYFELCSSLLWSGEGFFRPRAIGPPCIGGAWCHRRQQSHVWRNRRYLPAGSGLAAALRGLPIKVISVTHDRPVHELIVAPSITSPAELKGEAIAVGSLEGTAAVIVRRILQAKGLDPQKDITLLSMETTARLQSLLSGRVAGGMVTPPTTYLTLDRGFRVLARGRDHLRYLQTGVVTTDANIKQRRGNIVRFLRAWNRGIKFYRDYPEIMIPYIQQKLGVKDPQLARRMYEDDAPSVSLTGILNSESAKEILDIGRKALRIKEPIPTEKVYDFSLAADASK